MINNIKKTDFGDQVKTNGVKSSFHKGVIYRYPGMVPLLEVSGDHYQMGLQYGVLLRSEILDALKSYQKVLEWQAKEIGMAYSDLITRLKKQTKQISERLPERFLREMKGISDGSGVPYETVLLVSLIYDALEAAAQDSGGCTGVLLKGKSGTIIHGRNNDTAAGEEASKILAVVRHRAEGYNAVTHIDFVLWCGVETGYNDKGLRFSEETLKVKEPNPNGFSLTYLIRMALEECATLEEFYPLFDRYPVIGAYGCVLSHQKQGRGMVVELTPTSWKAKEMDGSLMWNFNHLYDANLRRQQSPAKNIGNENWDREAIAKTFPLKKQYQLKDAIEFLRLQKGPDNIDYSRHGLKYPICNCNTHEMVVFDPEGDGFYFASGAYHASCKEVYHIQEDFSRPPVRFMEVVLLDPLVEQTAAIENRLETSVDKLDAFVELAKQNPKDAHMQFIAAVKAFQLGRGDLLISYAQKAFTMVPDIIEHRLYAGIAACLQKDPEEAIKLLEKIEPGQLYPNQELYRLTILEYAWSTRNPDVSITYAQMKSDILQKHDARNYFESEMLSLLTALGIKINSNI